METYDSLGRPSTTLTQIWDASLGQMRYFVVRRGFDGFGRLQKEEWEHTAPTPRPALTVAYGYSNYGGVAQLASSVGLLWSAQGRDALSRLTQATQGTNVVTSYGYNAFTGQLTRRC